MTDEQTLETEATGLLRALIRNACVIKLPVTVGEKGVNWRRLVVKGTPGHGSMPFRTDNALVTAAEVVRRVASYQPKARILDEWRAYVHELELPAELEAALVDPDRVLETARHLEPLGFARLAHACTHTTFSPQLARAAIRAHPLRCRPRRDALAEREPTAPDDCSSAGPRRPPHSPTESTPRSPPSGGASRLHPSRRPGRVPRRPPVGQPLGWRRSVECVGWGLSGRGCGAKMGSLSRRFVDGRSHAECADPLAPIEPIADRGGGPRQW